MVLLALPLFLLLMVDKTFLPLVDVLYFFMAALCFPVLLRHSRAMFLAHPLHGRPDALRQSLHTPNHDTGSTL
jgi:hypothetical protein